MNPMKTPIRALLGLLAALSLVAFAQASLQQGGPRVTAQLASGVVKLGAKP